MFFLMIISDFLIFTLTHTHTRFRLLLLLLLIERYGLVLPSNPTQLRWRRWRWMMSLLVCALLFVFTFGAKIQKKNYSISFLHLIVLLCYIEACFAWLFVCCWIWARMRRGLLRLFCKRGRRFRKFWPGTFANWRDFFCQLFSYFISSLFFYT